MLKNNFQLFYSPNNKILFCWARKQQKSSFSIFVKFASNNLINYYIIAICWNHNFSSFWKKVSVVLFNILIEFSIHSCLLLFEMGFQTFFHYFIIRNLINFLKRLEFHAFNFIILNFKFGDKPIQIGFMFHNLLI
jgi:hypothetical protein